MQRGEESGSEVGEDREMILKEERAKKMVEVWKIEVEKNDSRKRKEKLLWEVTVKIGLKQKEEKKEIVVEVLLDSRAMGLVMSEEFVKRHKFRRTKLERLIYMRNVDGTLNYAGTIVNIVEIELFFKGHKERMLIDVIER